MSSAKAARKIVSFEEWRECPLKNGGRGKMSVVENPSVAFAPYGPNESGDRTVPFTSYAKGDPTSTPRGEDNGNGSSNPKEMEEGEQVVLNRCDLSALDKKMDARFWCVLANGIVDGLGDVSTLENVGC